MSTGSDRDRDLSLAFATAEADLRHSSELKGEIEWKPTGRSAAHRINSVLAIAIVILLVLSPVPVGSNRPPLWMAWAVYIGCASLAYGAALLWTNSPSRMEVSKLKAEMILWLALLVVLCLQLLPLGGLLPLGELTLNGMAEPYRRLSLDPGSTMIALLQFTTYGLLYFLVLQVGTNRRRARRLLYVILAITTGFAILGLASLTLFGDTLLGFEKTAYQGYATGTFINRNSFATYLAAGLALGTALLVQVIAEREDRTLSGFLGVLGTVIVALALLAAALLATASRAGMLAASIGVCSVALLGLVANRGATRAVIIVVLFAIVAASILLGVYGENLVQRLIFAGASDAGRQEGYAVVWSAIMQRPFLGYGAGSFAAVFQSFQGPPMSVEAYWVHSHSTYLALWFEMGFIVGSIPLAMIALAMGKALMALRDSSSSVVSLAAIGTVIVFAVHSVVDFSAEIQANSFLLVTMMALGASGYRAVTGRESPHGAQQHQS